ncbi:peptide-methionine (S)-S-oxide reductase MsrA [Methanolobus halotolerans]|uniref:Peptide methionine sulfoxide reductase MsrA n=1 Tax=Methanolobus halotolerans TaxID=2052935 RepID=A0A4E0Q5W2_9EURY|nr:peptide-methionine (S)-S-oxide reductase MsrA [Methanolobus halotolerans]TGC09366.1 peptide-methionine (S)-S-oxide reductase [Methanolobus halotolerans]
MKLDQDYGTDDLKEKLLDSGYETATFAAGSFWRAEAIFRRVSGVIATSVGFIGGSVKYPTYQQVSTGDTGHVEAVQIIFDPHIVPYEKLLELFWELHNPTISGQEGPEVPSQYRSVIFYHNERQHDIAIASKNEQASSGKFKRSIATEILPATRFYKAREYHQQYYEKMDGGKKLL